MQTIIINTLGEDYPRRDVYYRAFAPDQVLWLERRPDELHECVQLIRNDRLRRAEISDYNLIILINTDQFECSEYADQRVRIRRVLRAWTVHQLLKPLDELSETPASATLFFVNSRNKDGATSPLRSYRDMFGITAKMHPGHVGLPFHTADGTAYMLDFSAVFGTLQSPETAPAGSADGTASETAVIMTDNGPDDSIDEPDSVGDELRRDREGSRLESIEVSIERALRDLQSFFLKSNASEEMKMIDAVFCSGLTDRRTVNADVQINLARLIKDSCAGGIPDIGVIRCHTPEQLAQLMADAEETLRESLESSGDQPIYIKLTEPFSPSNAAKLSLDIRDRLDKEAQDVPGVGPALRELKLRGSSADANWKAADDGTLIAQVRKELRSGMLSLIRERRLFSERYKQLTDEYDRERVLSEQRRVFDICADSYSSWRAGMIGFDYKPALEPTEREMPVLEPDENGELIAARERCAKGILSKLDDYEDVREEAARLHTDFTAESRLWSPAEEPRSTEQFYKFSLVMGLVFVVLMLLPFFLISSQASDLKLSRAAAYLINCGAFILLYAAGVVVWMRALARKLRELRAKLQLLILKSAEKRRLSVLRTVTVYETELPLCLIKQLNYNAKLKADGINKLTSKKYEQHMRLINDALGEISEIRTALRTQRPAEPPRSSGAMLDILSAPYEGTNRELYMLFRERSADKDGTD